MRARACRIGIDLDSCPIWRLLATYFNACHFFPETRVEVDETGHGFHIKIFKHHNLEQNFEVRRALGDDPIRIGFDEDRVRHGLEGWVDTLFEVKFSDGKTTREEEIDPLMLPFHSRLPCRKLHV